MRILFVSGLTGYATGGVQTEMVRLIGGARAAGAEVAFVVDRLPGRLADVRQFPIDYPPSARAAEQVSAAVAAFGPDCVHVIGGGLNILRPVDQMRLPVPWVFTTHNLPPFERISSRFPGRPKLHYWVRDGHALPTVLAWKWLLRRGTFTAAIAHSRVVAAHLVAYGCPAAKVAMIPFGCGAASAVIVDPAASPFPADAYPKVLTVAGYANHKGIHDYIAAVAALVRQFPKIAYRVIGNSRNKEYTQFLTDRITALGLADRVALLRNAGDDVKHAALAAADLYVQPSHEEGFCLAFAEAAMVAPRLIGCNTGEIAGLAVDDPTARVVEPKDVPGLVAATGQLLAVRVTPVDVAARAERLRGRYSWAAYLDRHLALFTRPAEVAAAMPLAI